jgi:hypothetical protein
MGRCRDGTPVIQGWEVAMKKIRVALLAAGIGGLLGCGGLSGPWTLGGAEFRFGEAVVVPADFPMRPPEGEPLGSIVEQGCTRISYAVDGPPKILLSGYERQMRAAGREVERGVEDDRSFVVGIGQGERWYASIKPYGDRYELFMEVSDSVRGCQ